MSEPSDPASDIALLRRFEPIVHYTWGEHFFPMDVEPYVRACSLWVDRPGVEPECLVPQGELTLDRLVQPRVDEFGTVYYLRLTNPLNPLELAAYNRQRRHAERTRFDVGRGRLARVGYVSRFIDALFALTLLARGRVPGDAAAAAVLAYERMVSENRHHCYHGRVVRESGWIALQYWFFYAYNDWRSGFHGVNDHEADWEMIYVYLSESRAGELRPEWIAYATHDFAGDDLRRRWDDPEVEKIGEHPVIYAGAGSHAAYFAAGEYLAEVPISFLKPVARVVNRMRWFWLDALGQRGNEETEWGFLSALSVPFVDYARGDGVAIGPGQPVEWDTPRLPSPPPTWASAYRGLWGLYARDPLDGENAPSGPMYNRDGTVRHSWCDPLGWAGMDKVPTSDQTLETVEAQQVEAQKRLETLRAQVQEQASRLRQLGVEATAMVGQPHLNQMHKDHQKQIAQVTRETRHLRAQMTEEQALLESLARYADRLRAGERGPLRGHIRRAHRPTPPEQLRFDRVAEVWSAISISLMLIGFVLLVVFVQEFLLGGLIVVIALFVFIEAGFRGRIVNVLSNVGNALALIAALTILYEFFWPIVITAVLVAGGYVLVENLRELSV